MSKRIPKVGVIGVGVLGRFHTNIYKQNNDIEFIGVYDNSLEQAKKISEEFNVPYFETIDELADQCDCLSIAVPATKHYEIAMPLLLKDKHLLIEKPIATSVDEATELVELAQERGLVLGVGHIERFNPAMDYLESRSSLTRFIEAHRLASYPPPRPGQHRRGVEVGVVLDLMIHDLDLVLTMIGDEIEHIDAVGIPVLSKTEDIANVRLRFKNGSVANLTASRVSTEPMRRFRVFQTDSYISMDYGAHDGYIVKKSKIGIAKKEVNLNKKNALADELNDFINCVIETTESGSLKETKVAGYQGLRALKLAIEITEEINRYNKHYNVDFT
jgi:predicted dehydrogenase